MSVQHIGTDPFIVTEAKGNELYAAIQPVLSKLGTESWPALHARTSELVREVNGAAYRLSRFREDVKERPEQRADLAAAFEKTYVEARAKADSLHKDSQSILGILKAEIVGKARPRVTPEREGFVRQDLTALLNDSSDPLTLMNAIAAGEHRDRAALVVSDFADPYLHRLVPDKSTRERFREGLSASLIEGSIKYGTEGERAAARAVKEVLPKVAGWVATQTTPAMSRLKEAEGMRP
jgi:hypothetical protein